MKKILLTAIAALALLMSPAHADVGVMNDNIVYYSDPTPQSTPLSGYCDTGNLLYHINTGIYYVMTDCANPLGGTATQILPVTVGISDVTGLTSALAGKFNSPTGTTSQYIRGNGTNATFPTNVSSFTNDSGYVTSSALTAYLTTSTASSTYFPIPAGTTSQYLTGTGSLVTFPTNLSSFSNGPGYITSSALVPYLQSAGAAAIYYPIPTGTSAQYLDGTGAVANFGIRSFAYPSRALNGCFQVSSTKDADVNYSVDITAGVISLGGGTAALTSYANSGCTTGAQTLFNGSVSSVALGGTSSIPLHAIAKLNTWLKVTGSGTGGGSAGIDAVQAETLLQ